MKKFILSLVTISSFAAYAIFFGKSNNLTSVKNESSTVSETLNQNTGDFKDGAYVGNSADAYYGYIQVQAVIKNGALADVIFLDYPKDRDTSIKISNYAMPILKSEAIQAQSAKVATVSGATDSSIAFRESLALALSKAKK